MTSTDALLSKKLIRILIFNITHGRSGPSFLGAMDAATAAQLKLYGRDEASESFFDQVIFCTNVTYADGVSKSGTCLKVIAIIGC